MNQEHVKNGGFCGINVWVLFIVCSGWYLPEVVQGGTIHEPADRVMGSQGLSHIKSKG